jgi:hypothetical protein
MTEVYSGSRPGRPVLLLIASAVVLLGTLGLALVQVERKLALGEEYEIPDTPLRARAPRGWHVDRRDPQAFILPVRRGVPGREQWDIDRLIRFGFARQGAFEPPADLLRAMVSTGTDAPVPARIGAFHGVQVQQLERRRWRRYEITRESVLRMAVLPGGDVITVRYTPMTQLTLADLKLLDKVCSSIQLDDEKLSVSPEQAGERVGMELAFEPDWQAGLAAFPEVAGCYIGGTDSGFPAWSIGVFRTWLAGGRQPTDLLHDFAAYAWLLLDEGALRIEQWQRDDGATVSVLRHPDPSRNRHAIDAAWVLSKSPAEVAIFYVYTNERHRAAAQAAAEKMARGLTFRPSRLVPDVNAAQRAGAELAALLTREGVVSWWGRLPVKLLFAGETLRGSEGLRIERRPLGRRGELGYQGNVVRRVADRFDEQTAWNIGPRARAYEYEFRTYVGDGLSIEVREERAADATEVTRVIKLGNGRTYRRAFRPGPTFVCKPIESIAEAQVARSSQPHLFEGSLALGRGTYTRLLRPLPPVDGRSRVLVQEDFWPFGAVLTLGEDDEMLTYAEADARYQRLPADR